MKQQRGHQGLRVEPVLWGRLGRKQGRGLTDSLLPESRVTGGEPETQLWKNGGGDVELGKGVMWQLF